MECEAAEVGRRKMMAAGTLGGGGKKAVQSLDSFSDGVRWRPPAFLLKGMRLTSDGGRVYTKDYLLALRASQMAQDGQEASGGSLRARKASPGGPSAAVAASDVQIRKVCVFAAERAAALAELAQISARNAEAAAEIERLAGKLEDARNGVGSGGLAMTMSLRKLMARHNVQAERLPPLPLAEPVDAPSVRIRGIAATSDIDLDRTRFLRDCWPKLDPGQIKLVVGHDLSREVGTINEINVDLMGRVTIVATVTDKDAARLPGLSISAMVAKYTICNPDDRFRFAGEVERVSDVNEVSLTSNPGNRNCLVLERWIPSPLELSNEAIIAKLRDIQATVAAMRATGVFARAA